MAYLLTPSRAASVIDLRISTKDSDGAIECELVDQVRSGPVPGEVLCDLDRGWELSGCRILDNRLLPLSCELVCQSDVDTFEL